MSTVARADDGRADRPTALSAAGLRGTARAEARGSVHLGVNISGDAPPVPVVLVGPPRESMGGMSSVMQQMASLDMGGRYSFRPFYATSSPSEHEGRFSKVIRHVRHLYKLHAAIRTCRAGIAHIHTCSGVSFARSIADLLVARNAGCRTVLHVHGGMFEEFFASRSGLGKRLIAGALRLPHRVVALSQDWQRSLGRMSPRARIVVMENATAIPDTADAGRRDGPCRFLFLGGMDTWKGIDELLDAAHILKQRRVPFHLTLAGPPGTAGDAVTLKASIASSGLRDVVEYTGAVFGADKDRVLREADVYIQPSLNEGMPISLLEAMAYGLAIVATRVGAVPEVIAHGREGLLVDAKRVPPLASAMETLVFDDALRDSMSAAARRLARGRFGLGRLQSDLLTLYDGLSVVGVPYTSIMRGCPTSF